jgi:hypothetical protein
VDIIGAGILTILLLPFVAFMASIRRGFMPAFGWVVLTVVMAQIAAEIGWAAGSPRSISALNSAYHRDTGQPDRARGNLLLVAQRGSE